MGSALKQEEMTDHNDDIKRLVSQLQELVRIPHEESPANSHQAKEENEDIEISISFDSSAEYENPKESSWVNPFTDSRLFPAKSFFNFLEPPRPPLSMLQGRTDAVERRRNARERRRNVKRLPKYRMRQQANAPRKINIDDSHSIRLLSLNQ